MPREPSALGMQRGGAAVDVVVAGSARGERKVAETKADLCQKGQKLLSIGSHQVDCKQGSENRDQRTEIREQRSENRDQRSGTGERLHALKLDGERKDRSLFPASHMFSRCLK